MPAPARGSHSDGGRSTTLPRLITIPLSHYCEKARWALQYAQVPFRESAHLPLLHRLDTSRVGCGSVPVLVTADATFRDSAAITSFLVSQPQRGRLLPEADSLCAQALQLESYFDVQLGPHTRRWAYSEILDTPVFGHCVSQSVPRWERMLAPVAIPLLRRLIRRGYRINVQSAARSLEKIHQVFTHVGELIHGRRYLVGDRFTIADLTFAALSAPAVFPKGYGGVIPDESTVPPGMLQEIRRFRASPAGDFALRIYREQRFLPTS